VRIFWTDTAIQHLSAIYSYIAQNSPQYAQQAIDRLTRRSQQIANFPLSGRVVPEFETQQIREVIEGSYSLSHADEVRLS
jgi:plasmid stabilization system protein ParE